MKLVVVYTYGEPYEVGYHDSVTCVEYESPEKFYVDLCEDYKKQKDNLGVVSVGYYKFYLDDEMFESLKVLTLEEFWESYVK